MAAAGLAVHLFAGVVEDLYLQYACCSIYRHALRCRVRRQAGVRQGVTGQIKVEFELYWLNVKFNISYYYNCLYGDD